MSNVRFVERAPRELKYRLGADDPALRKEDIETIAEIFKTPLVGSYTWNYEESDRRIRKLYRLGKERNWNAETDIDWSKPVRLDETPIVEGIENRECRQARLSSLGLKSLGLPAIVVGLIPKRFLRSLRLLECPAKFLDDEFRLLGRAQLLLPEFTKRLRDNLPIGGSHRPLRIPGAREIARGSQVDGAERPQLVLN